MSLDRRLHLCIPFFLRRKKEGVNGDHVYKHVLWMHLCSTAPIIHRTMRLRFVFGALIDGVKPLKNLELYINKQLTYVPSLITRSSYLSSFSSKKPGHSPTEMLQLTCKTLPRYSTSCTRGFQMMPKKVRGRGRGEEGGRGTDKRKRTRPFHPSPVTHHPSPFLDQCLTPVSFSVAPHWHTRSPHRRLLGVCQRAQCVLQDSCCSASLFHGRMRRIAGICCFGCLRVLGHASDARLGHQETAATNGYPVCVYNLGTVAASVNTRTETERHARTDRETRMHRQRDAHTETRTQTHASCFWTAFFSFPFSPPIPFLAFGWLSGRSQFIDDYAYAVSPPSVLSSSDLLLLRIAVC